VRTGPSLRIGDPHSGCFSRRLVKTAHSSRQLPIEECSPAKDPTLPVTCRADGDLPTFEHRAFLHDAGPASQSVESGRSPTGSEDRLTWSRAHLRTSNTRRAMPGGR